MPDSPCWRPIPSIFGLFGGRSDPNSELFLKKSIPYGSPGQSASPKMILYWSSHYEVFIEKVRTPLNFLSQINFFATIFGKLVFHFKPSEARFVIILCFFGSLKLGCWILRIVNCADRAVGHWSMAIAQGPLLNGHWSMVGPENGLKSRCFVRGCLKKVKKTSGRSAVQAENDNPYNENTAFGTLDRRRPETVSAAAASTPDHTRRGQGWR